MGCPGHKYDEGTAAVGGGGEVVDKDESYSEGMSDDVQGGGSDIYDLWERELVSDSCNAECAGGVPPSSGLADCKDFRLASWGGGMGVVIGGGGLGGGRDVSNEGFQL